MVIKNKENKRGLGALGIYPQLIWIQIEIWFYTNLICWMDMIPMLMHIHQYLFLVSLGNGI